MLTFLFFQYVFQFCFCFWWDINLLLLLFLDNNFVGVLTLILFCCSFLLTLVDLLLEKGVIQRAFLTSQSSLSWCLHVVLKIQLLDSAISRQHISCPLSSPVLLKFHSSPRSFSSLWGPIPEGSSGRSVPGFTEARLHQRALGLVWFRVARTPAVFDTVLKVSLRFAVNFCWLLGEGFFVLSWSQRLCCVPLLFL